MIETEEVRIDTGERHGAFYRPIPEWMQTAIEWAKGGARQGSAATVASDRDPVVGAVPEWVTKLGYEEGELFNIHTGPFGFPFVRVVINGAPFDLPFDTGNMVGIALRPDEIEPLGLELAETWDRLSSDGRVVGTFGSYSGATVEVWGEIWRNQQVFEFDDPDLAGLLGPQFLLGKRYTLDYESSLMAISGSRLAAEIAGMETIPLVESARNPGLILFYGSVHGRRVLIQADTGKSRCTIDPELARELGLQENERGFQVDDLRIGSHTFEVPSAKVVELRAIDNSLEDPILLGIGSDILSQVPMTVDYIAGRLLLPRSAMHGEGDRPIAQRP
jgi:predicted aspartyl protease